MARIDHNLQGDVVCFFIDITVTVTWQWTEETIDTDNLQVKKSAITETRRQ
jgi:L-fucose isomerase-like protein